MLSGTSQLASLQSHLPWYTSKHFRRTAWVLFGIVLVIWFINGVLLRHNDFRHHYKLGVGFLEGKPYLVPDSAPSQDIYPVGRLLLNAPLLATVLTLTGSVHARGPVYVVRERRTAEHCPVAA